MPMPTPMGYPRGLVEPARAVEPQPRPSALLVGFDGSLTAFGWSVLTIEDRPRVLRVGCVLTKPEPKTKHTYQADRDGARVDDIADGVLAALDWALAFGVPVLVAIEAPAGAQHAASAKALGLSYGLSRAVCRARKVTPITVQAFEVKATTGGSKGASKDDVARGVERLTGWKSSAKTAPAREGESDAVGVALTAMRHPIASALRPREAGAAPQPGYMAPEQFNPGPLAAGQGRNPVSPKDSVRSPGVLAAGRHEPLSPEPQLFAGDLSGGEGETGRA